MSDGGKAEICNGASSLLVGCTSIDGSGGGGTLANNGFARKFNDVEANRFPAWSGRSEPFIGKDRLARGWEGIAASPLMLDMRWLVIKNVILRRSDQTEVDVWGVNRGDE